MQVSIVMDGNEYPLQVFMVRHDSKPVWRVSLKCGELVAERDISDLQAAATVALAVGGFEQGQAQQEQGLYALVGEAWDGINPDLRPVP
jgi:hypothetical protein